MMSVNFSLYETMINAMLEMGNYEATPNGIFVMIGESEIFVTKTEIRLISNDKRLIRCTRDNAERVLKEIQNMNGDEQGYEKTSDVLRYKAL